MSEPWQNTIILSTACLCPAHYMNWFYYSVIVFSIHCNSRPMHAGELCVRDQLGWKWGCSSTTASSTPLLLLASTTRRFELTWNLSSNTDSSGSPVSSVRCNQSWVSAPSKALLWTNSDDFNFQNSKFSQPVSDSLLFQPGQQQLNADNASL